MFKFRRTYIQIIKFACLGSLSTGVGWFAYQLKCTGDTFSSAIDPAVLSIHDSIEIRNAESDNFLIINNSGVSWSIESFWNRFLFAYSKRLIALSKSNRQTVRKNAVRQLGYIESLDHWHFSELSQLIDSRTAVGLARTLETDLRFFPEPPFTYMAHTHVMLVELLKDLLIRLNEKDEHACLGWFVNKVFRDHEDVSKFIEVEDGSTAALKIYTQSHHDLIPLCLETLAHHASLGRNAKSIVELNGLPILLELYNRYQNNKQVVITIGRIISHISRHTEHLIDLFKTGWITMLAHWTRDEDIRLSLPAVRALANLDPDENHVYQQRIYPLHPQTRSDEKVFVDVIFIHGLLGGVFYTWRQRKRTEEVVGLMDTVTKDVSKLEPRQKMKEFIVDIKGNIECSYNDYQLVLEDLPVNINERSVGPFSYPIKKFESTIDYETFTNCWPQDWLPEDCQHLRIIGVNYETNLSMWSPVCPTIVDKNLAKRAEEVMWQLINVGVGDRPIVWIVHSMGGLITKNMLNYAAQSHLPNVRNLFTNTEAIVFFSTPHLGSSMAKLNQASALLIWPTIEVQELQYNSPYLIAMHQNFLSLLEYHPIKIISFVENEPTTISSLKFRFQIVEPASGDPGVGEKYEIPLDHLGICKPSCRHSFLYQKVLHLIRTVVKEAKKKDMDGDEQ